MKKAYIYTILVMLCYTLLAQNSPRTDSTRINLVFNGSFEEYRHCPKKIDNQGVLTIVDGWYQPTKGSADYFNVCGGKECGVPNNKMGTQIPHKGNGYCGIYCSKNNYREYLQTRLRRRLHAGDSILVTFYVSLAEESSCAISTIGALFTPSYISDTIRDIFLNKVYTNLGGGISQVTATTYEPQIFNTEEKPLTNYRDWQPISGLYVAHGGEQYITLGNFFTADHSGYSEPDSLTHLLPGAYYYLDDVTVECLNCKPPVADDLNVDSIYLTHEQPTFSVGGTFVLKEIFFEFNQSTLLQQSYFELQKLLSLMATYPKMRIEIGGHTDGKGSDAYNQRLSENRAKAVVDYLISKGVSPKRLQFKGYGKSHPIDTNETEEGRANNRRVEFKITSI